jgi:cation diffusion facilitator family transporter
MRPHAEPHALSDRALTRRRGVVRVLWIVFVLNVIVAAAKLAYGQLSGAIAMSADGLHSLLDASSNVIALVGIALARRPPDADHPYGHRKYETFAALGIVMMLMIACWEIATAAVSRLLRPQVPDVTVAGFWILGITITVNLFVVWVERREGERLKSVILHSDAAHTATDVLVSLIVLASFVAARWNVAWADGGAAAVVIVFILRAAIQILRVTLATLADERRIPPAEIEAEAVAEPNVREAHNVRSRGPEDDIHIDLHVLVDPLIPIAEAHAIGHRVEQRLRRRWPDVSDVVVHVEPANEEERARDSDGEGLRAPG